MQLLRFILFLVLLNPFWIQSQHYHVKLFNYSNGLEADQVYYSFTNEKGYLFLATSKGNIVYDGYRFIRLSTKVERIQSYYYRAPYYYFEDGRGLWRMNTQSIHNKPELITEKNFQDGDPNNDHFKNLYIDQNNRIWCTDYEHVKYLGKNGWISYLIRPKNNVTLQYHFCEDDNGHVYFSTRNEVYASLSGGKPQSRYQSKLDDIHTISYLNNSLAIFKTPDNNTLPFSNKELRTESFPFKQVLLNAKNSFAITENAVYVRRNNQWIKIYEHDQWKFNHISYNEHTYQLWISTQQGLIQLSSPNNAVSNYPISSSQTTDSIIAIQPLNVRKAYVASQNGKIWLLNDSEVILKHQFKDKEKPLHFLTISKNHYIVTNNGIYSLSDNANVLKQMSIDPHLFTSQLVKVGYVDNKEFWFVYRHAVIQRWNTLTSQKISTIKGNHQSFWESNRWNDFLQDKLGNIWLVGWMPTGFGISKYNASADSFVDISSKQFGNDRSMFVGDYYNRINQGQGNTLLASAYGGFNRLDQNGVLKQKIDTHEFPFEDGYFTGILDDDLGNIFVGTSNGLYVYLKEKNKIVKIGRPEGLPSNDVTLAFTQLDSILYIGSIGSFSLVNMKQVNEPIRAYPISITEIQLNVKSFIPTSTPWELGKNLSSLVIQFSNLAFQDVEKILYRYRLNNGEWTKLGHQSTVQFNLLPPGDYLLELQAHDLFDNQLGETLRINFSIRPTFIQSWYFKLIITGGFFLFVWGIFKYMWFRKEKEARLKRKVDETEMEVLRTQMNPHFIFNTLNSINSYIIQQKDKDASTYLTTFAQLMRQILDNSQRQSITLQEELKGLKWYLSLESARLDNGFNIDLFISPEIDKNEVMIPPLIIQPFAENAIWHGLRHLPRKGTLSIAIGIKDDFLVIEISDDGIGREEAKRFKRPNEEGKSHGIDITRKRIKMLHPENTLHFQDLKAENGSALGTKVILSLKLSYEN